MSQATIQRFLDHAVSAVFAEGEYLTPDQGGMTIEFCGTVARALDTEDRHA